MRPWMAMRHCRGRARIGRQFGHRLGRHRHRAVARQIAGPVLVARAEGLFDQYAPEPRAIDEQVGFHALAALEKNRLHEAVFGLLVPHDLAVVADDSPAFGLFAQEARVERGVEMIGVGDITRSGQDRMPSLEAVGGRSAGGQRIIVELAGGFDSPLGEQAPPVMRHGQRPHAEPEHSERMVVTRAVTHPVDELDGELERARGLADELVLVDPEKPVQR